MTRAQAALFRCLLVVFLTVLAMIVTAPTRATVADLQPSLVTTPSTTPPVLAHIEAP